MEDTVIELVSGAILRLLLFVIICLLIIFRCCYYRTEEHYCVLAPFRNLVICASCVDILPKLFCNWFIWPIAEANSLRSTVLDSLVGTFVGVEEEQVCFVFVYSE